MVIKKHLMGHKIEVGYLRLYICTDFPKVGQTRKTKYKVVHAPNDATLYIVETAVVC
jgi:hypothetical protein